MKSLPPRSLSSGQVLVVAASLLAAFGCAGQSQDPVAAKPVPLNKNERKVIDARPAQTATPRPPGFDGEFKSTPESLERLKALGLKETITSDEQLSILASSNTELQGLAGIHLEGKAITDKGVIALAQMKNGRPDLKLLSIGETAVTSAGIRTLAEAEISKNLEVLVLKATENPDDLLIAFAGPKCQLRSLRSLMFFPSIGTALTDRGMKALTRPDTALKALEFLSLDHTGITDESLQLLAHKQSGLKKLKHLSIAGGKFSDEGVKLLAQEDTSLKNLTYLNISMNTIGDPSLKSVTAKTTGLKSLVSLAMQLTTVTDDGLIEFAASESGVPKLIELDVSWTKVHKIGADAVRKRWPQIDVRVKHGL